jgi:hypothetical protein
MSVSAVNVPMVATKLYESKPGTEGSDDVEKLIPAEPKLHPFNDRPASV